jgi:hypothetical protein
MHDARGREQRGRLLSMSTLISTGLVSPQYEQALRLMTNRNAGLNATTITEIARLLVVCSDAEKCLAHYVMDNHIVGENPLLRGHWLRTKSDLPNCMPEDGRVWRELLAIARKQGRKPQAMRRLCSTAGCGGKHLATGLCRKCYDHAHRQERYERNKRWLSVHPEKGRARASRSYWRNRVKILKRAAEKRRAQGHS